MGWGNEAAPAQRRWQRHDLRSDAFTHTSPAALAAGSPSAPRCLCKSPFGTGSRDSFSQASWWSTPGTTTSKASPAVIASLTSTSFPALSLCFLLASSISRLLMWQMLQHCPHLPRPPSSSETQRDSAYKTSDVCSAFTWAFHTPELADVLLKSALKYVTTPLKNKFLSSLQ